MPDLLLFNGKLHTQDAKTPHASAIALRGGRILAIGDDAEIRTLARTETRQIDLQGKRVLPGLNDSHIHFYEWALFRRGPSLKGATSLQEVQERVRKKAAEYPKGKWIIGQGWNQDAWFNPRLPNRFDLDQVTPHNPTILWRTDLHLAWANSLALEAAGISSNTPDPGMGIIERHSSGQPSGILRELAINIVRSSMPAISDTETDEAMLAAMTEMHMLGITGVHDFRIMGGDDGPPALRAWQRIRAQDKLNLRAWVLLPGELLAEAIALGLQTGFGDDFLRIGAVKYFADGATGPRTAWMLEPFEDSDAGMPLTPMEEIAGGIWKAHQAGISTATHAIGDRAIRELLDVFSEISEQFEGQSHPLAPHRIEHVQHSHPDDLARLGPLGLVASVQPLHILDDMEMIENACGTRARWAYAFRDMLESGTVLALGSDCPVASPNPFLGIHAAVTRKRRDGTPGEGWHPSQRLTLAEAIRGYSMGAAIACGQERHLGSLSPGKLADLIVLDRDIFAIPSEEIPDLDVAMTIFDGRIVYSK